MGNGYAIVFRILDVGGIKLDNSKSDIFGVGADFAKVLGGIEAIKTIQEFTRSLFRNNDAQRSSAAVFQGAMNSLQMFALGESLTQIDKSTKIIRDESTSVERGSIALYMPTRLIHNYNFGWETADLAMTRAVMSAASSMSLKDGMPNFNNLEPYREFFGREIGARAAEQILGGGVITDLNFKSLIESSTKTVKNPYLQFLFKNVAPRKFEFDFKLAPRNAKEAQEIQDIIYAFKFFAHPSVTSNDSLYLTYPAEFEIAFIQSENSDETNNQTIETISRISRCVCTSISVNYTGHGEGLSMIRNEEDRAKNHPSEIHLSLAFDETKFLTRNDINQGY